MTQTPATDPQGLRQARLARLFALYRSESLSGTDLPATAPRIEVLPPEEAARLQQTAIASLSRETPWPRRIFPRNRIGWPGA